MTRTNGIRRHPGEKHIDLRSGRICDDQPFVQPHVYREIPPMDWGPIAGPAREAARARILARQSVARAAR